MGNRGHGVAEAFYARSFGQEGRLCNVDAEIQRSVRFGRWLKTIAPERLVSARRPRVDEPLISVIVPMYNAAEWAEAMLKSLLLQKENLEIFCVDDASTDDTYLRVTRAFAADGRVCAIRLQANVGPYQIRNWVAAQLARGEWLAFQDADDLSHPNRFFLQKVYLEQSKEVACGVCAHQVFPKGLSEVRRDTPSREYEEWLHNLACYPDVPQLANPRPVDQVLRERSPHYLQHAGGRIEEIPSNGSAALYPTLVIKRNVFLAFGGFDGRTRIAADRTFAHRLARFHRIVNLPAVLYTRRILASSLTQSAETGYSSTLRREYLRDFQNTERKICLALADEDHAQLRRLCSSDLYHADIRVAEARCHFPIPNL